MGNRAYRFRISPNKEQAVLLKKTFGCCRFLYNRMLSDKKRGIRENGKMPRITPAGYKKDMNWLKEVDSLALANVQLQLEAAYRRFFDEGANRFPKFKAKHHSRKSYTTNVVNRNIRIEGKPDPAAKGRGGEDPPAPVSAGGVETEVRDGQHGSLRGILCIHSV